MFRKITSFIMLFSFIIMVISGTMLFISPFGRLSMMIQWEVMGLNKMDYQALHLTFMLLFTIAGIVHILYNWKPIKNYLKNRSKKIVFFTKEFVVASLITIALFFATVKHIEPLESFVKMNKSFNNYWVKSFKEKRMREMNR
ncbi:MAG: DUF4405 domain-containing protein [Sulfurimonas sp.]|nr:DUF4405 domain-containing protein [Sulfurimonas sp.]